MSTELIINASLPETRISLMENGEIQELLIERASGKGIVGNIYKGRVTRVLPGMQAAFVDIGLEKAAFLYVDDVFVHSEIWEREEGEPTEEELAASNSSESGEHVIITPPAVDGEAQQTAEADDASNQAPATDTGSEASGGLEGWSEEDIRKEIEGDDDEEEGEEGSESGVQEEDDDDSDLDRDDDEEDEDDEPVSMSAGGEGEGGGGGEGSSSGGEQPQGTMSAPSSEGSGGGEAQGAAGEGGADGDKGRKRHRRGRRGGRFRRDRERTPRQGQAGAPIKAGSGAPEGSEDLPENVNDQMADSADLSSDRSSMASDAAGEDTGESNRPQITGAEGRREGGSGGKERQKLKEEFKQQRGRDRRIKGKSSMRQARPQANIQDLLKEGQEVLVQVAKDPIATKGARLTCHISLPGRHLVCMPTIDHVGVSRRIERDDERRKLREYVERARPKGLGFIVRTASGKSSSSEKRITQDVDYLSRLWDEIREKSAAVTAPALVYEDLNSVLRAIRDWVTEDIDKIIVDSRYHFNEIQRFVAHFMPILRQKVELYHGDIPIFDAYNISTELSRALERKVWLKSGGYLVVDQAEALVAIDVNTGRFVGKKNLEDTILKTNLEAVQEIAYQLRLRNAGGIIILDLIDMEKEENKKRVYLALEEALKKDRARPTILKISELGLVEMTRKRTRDTMVRALCESCPHCEGKSYVKSKQTVAYEIMRQIEREGIEKESTKILVQAHADVIEILAIEERDTIDQLERRYRKQIYLQAITDYHPEQFEVAGDKIPAKAKIGRQAQSEARRESRGERDRDRGRSRRGGKGRDRDRSGGDREDRGDRGERESRGPIERNDRPERPERAERAEKPEAEQKPQRERVAIVIPPPSGKIYTPVEEPRAERPVAAEGDQPVQEVSNGTGESFAPRSTSPQDDGFDNEEDRLAFLRAQAAQDAALAKLAGGAAGSPAGGRPPRDGQGMGRGGGGRGGDRDRGGRGGAPGGRGRRGGRFRNDRGPGGRGPAGGGGRGFQPRGDRPQQNDAPQSAAPSDAGSNGGGGGGEGTPSTPPNTSNT